MAKRPLKRIPLVAGALCALGVVAGVSCSDATAPSAQRGPAPDSTRAPGQPHPPAVAGRGPSVLLVTIDTWRWDHVGASGQGRVETPTLDRLALEGVYLRKVQTTCPLTTPAHATILTGLGPRGHGIRDNQHFSLAPGVTTLAQRFKDAGRRTGAVISGAPLRRAYGLDRGFDHYDDTGLGIEGDNAVTPSSRPANLTTAKALDWLAGQPAGARVFLWVHYYDPHEPYAPPQPFLDRYASRPYAGEIAFVDSQLGSLLATVRADGARHWIVVVTGDHGEALGDHGERTHGVLLYGSTLEVPLIVWTGDTLPSPAAGPFSLLDVAPTVSALAGLDRFPGEGFSIFGGAPGGRWLAAESAYPALNYGLNPAVLLRQGPLVYIDQGSDEVYDLETDPGEAKNLADTPRGREFRRLAAEAKSRLFGRDMEQELLRGNLVLGREELESLKSLGYIASSRAGVRPLRRADLRQFALDLSGLQIARQHFSAKRYAESVSGYDAFLRSYPDSALAFQERGQALARLNRPDEAAKSFARARVLDPRDAISALNLGDLALARGDYGRAEAFFKESLASEEGQPEAHLNLGLLYLYKLHRPKEAKPHFRRFLELAPDDPEAARVRQLAGGI